MFEKTKGGPAGGPIGGGGVGKIAISGAKRVRVCGSFFGRQVHWMLSPALIQISLGRNASACPAWSRVSAPTLAFQVR